jgi:hypothetical protein
MSGIKRLACAIIFIYMLATTAQAVEAEKPSWRVVSTNGKRLTIEITTSKLKQNEYLAAAYCIVEFLDTRGHSLGKREFDFSVPLDAGKIKSQEFNHDLTAAASALGLSMHFKIYVYGNNPALKKDDTLVLEGDVPPQ